MVYRGLTIQPMTVDGVFLTDATVKIRFERTDIYRQTLYEISAKDAKRLADRLQELLGVYAVTNADVAEMRDRLNAVINDYT